MLEEILNRGKLKLWPLLFLIFALILTLSCTTKIERGPLVEIDCSIYPLNEADAIRLFPGTLCEYDGRGHVFSAYNKTLSKINFKTSDLLWSVETKVINHDMSYDSDRDLIFSIEREPYMKEGVYFLGAQVVARSSQTGEVLWKWCETEHEDVFNALSKKYSNAWSTTGKNLPNQDDLVLFPGAQEISYEFNQIEILSEGHPLLSRITGASIGDILVNLRERHVMMVLSFKTGEVIWSFDFPMALRQVHTVSFTGDSRILYFSNLAMKNPSRSAAIEYDLNSQRVLWKFTGENDSGFYYPIFSSVQNLSDNSKFIVDNTEGHEEFLIVGDQGEVLWRKSYHSYHYPKHMKVYRARVTSLNDYF